MFWNKEKPTGVEARRETPPIQFSGDDDLLKRAENIWAALGFVNDRHGQVAQMAAYLGMYRDWDEQRLECRVEKLEDAVRELNPGLNL